MISQPGPPGPPGPPGQPGYMVRHILDFYDLMTSEKRSECHKMQ